MYSFMCLFSTWAHIPPPPTHFFFFSLSLSFFPPFFPSPPPPPFPTRPPLLLFFFFFFFLRMNNARRRTARTTCVTCWQHWATSWTESTSKVTAQADRQKSKSRNSETQLDQIIRPSGSAIIIVRLTLHGTDCKSARKPFGWETKRSVWAAETPFSSVEFSSR